MAQNGQKQGWAPKNDPLLGNRIFFRDGLNGKVVALGILVIFPVDKNRNYHTKNWLFTPNIQIFGSKKGHFFHNFSTRKRCLIGFLKWGYQKFYSLPPKKWIFGHKTAKFCPKLAFLAEYRLFWPICSHTDQKTMWTSCPGGFSIMWLPKLFWPKNGQICSKKNNANKVPRGFSVMWVTKLLISPLKY